MNNKRASAIQKATSSNAKEDWANQKMETNECGWWSGVEEVECEVVITALLPVRLPKIDVLRKAIDHWRQRSGAI